jgi:hypothetical protein
VREWRRVVRAAVIQIDWRRRRQLGAELGRRLNVFTRPTSCTDKGCRDEEDARQLPIRWLLGERVYQDRCADRVADQDCAIVERRDVCVID